MEGRIVFINHQRGMYCAELSDGSYTVFELLDSNEINEEDIITGPLDELGECTLQNQTTEERFEAFVENTGINLKTAKLITSLQ